MAQGVGWHRIDRHSAVKKSLKLEKYIFLKKFRNSVDKVYGLCYYIYVAYDGNELNTVCGSGGTADALASGASGGDPVEVQILSTAPFKSQV